MSIDLSTISKLADLQSVRSKWRHNSQTIALVPTMGALHEGHLSLVKLARTVANKVIVSVFVNPKQFGQGEDLDQYPRDLSADLNKLKTIGVDLVYAPDASQIYPQGFSTNISVTGISEGLCGASRPHFFGGVATVVTKLLLHCTPDIALFGEKDYQQLLVIRRLVIDLDLPVDVMSGPIVRENDGLARSSRNIYLSKTDRQTAPLLHKGLLETRARLQKGAPMIKAAQQTIELLSRAGFQLDYFELCDANTLAPLKQYKGQPARLLIAATLGRTRLIDNIAVIG
ncbi:MAG: pantoate--beta-alanine ligase [bacterium]|nr:pantoate--beta-alanine ligase [bacterium]